MRRSVELERLMEIDLFLLSLLTKWIDNASDRPKGVSNLGLQCVVFTLRAKLSGAVYCNRSCLGFGCVCVFVCVCLWVCYHNNSKLRASIFTKLGL